MLPMMGMGAIGKGAASGGGPLGMLAGSSLSGLGGTSSATSTAVSGDITGDFNFNSGSGGGISDTGNLDLPRAFWIGAAILGAALVWRAIKK